MISKTRKLWAHNGSTNILRSNSIAGEKKEIVSADPLEQVQFNPKIISIRCSVLHFTCVSATWSMFVSLILYSFPIMITSGSLWLCFVVGVVMVIYLFTFRGVWYAGNTGVKQR